jgi:hypothetical protein
VPNNNETKISKRDRKMGDFFLKKYNIQQDGEDDNSISLIYN